MDMENVGVVAGIIRYLNYLAEDFMNKELNYKECMQVLTSKGFRCLGYGSFRICVTCNDTPGIVYKVVYTEDDYYPVEAMAGSEYRYYLKSTPQLKKHLAKCFWADRLVCVMEEVEAHSKYEYINYDDLLDYFKNQCRINNSKLWGYGLADMSQRNLILNKKGECILVDYSSL